VKKNHWIHRNKIETHEEECKRSGCKTVERVGAKVVKNLFKNCLS